MIRISALFSVLLASVALGACGSSGSSNIIATKQVSVAMPASGCGSVPTPAPTDKGGALKALGAKYQPSYAGYQTPVTKSVWADYKPDHPPPYKVGISWGPLVTDVQVKNYEGLQKLLKAQGIEVSATTTEGVNVPQQLGQFQSLLRAKPDILVLQANTDSFGSLVTEAGKRGIPTISVSNTTTGTNYVINMEPNNYLNGAMAASVVMRQIGGKGNVLLVHGFASTGVDQDRFKAYRAAIEACPSVKVAGEIAGAFIPATAKAETLKFLATHPGRVDAVLQTSGMAPGILSAFEQAGRPVPALGDVGAMNGSLAYWSDNKDKYNGFGLGFSQGDYAKAQTELIEGMLAGRGLTISDIVAPYATITTKNLGEWAKSGNDLRTPGIADGPGGTFMGSDFVAGLFARKGGRAMSITYYWHPGTCSRIPLIALEEIGATYDLQLVRRSDPEFMAAYTRDVNPKGKVPALVVDGRVITENPAIHIYLHGQHPEAGLLPSDPEGYLDAVMLMSWFAAGIHPMITRSRFPMFSSAVPESFASIKEIALTNLRDCFGQVEERLSDRDWLLGDWTIVDAYLLWLWFRGVGSGLTGDEFPRVDDLCRRCEERPSAARVLDWEERDYGEMERAGETMRNAPPMVAGRLPAPA